MSDNFLPACPKGTKAYAYVVVSSLDGTKVYAKAVGLVVPGNLAGNKPVIVLAAAADPTWVTTVAADFDGSAGGTVALPAGTYRLSFKQADSAGAADWQNDAGIAYGDERVFNGTLWSAPTPPGGSGSNPGPNLVADDRAAQHPQLAALRTASPTAFASLLAAASAMVRDHCKRDFNAADYTEYLSGGNFPYDSIVLAQVPVLSVARVATCPVTALVVRNTNTTLNQRATVATTAAGLTLNRVASAVPAANSLPFDTYPTISALAAAVTALGNGWSGTAAAGYELFPSADLRPLQGAVTCRNADAGLELYAEDVPAVAFSMAGADPTWWSSDAAWRLDAETGILLGRFPQGRLNVRVDYRAGFDAVPEPVQQACVDLAADLLGLQEVNGSFASVRVGPFAAELAAPARQLLRSQKISGPLSYYVDHSKTVGGRPNG